MTKLKSVKRIFITAGEPKGIGQEILVKAVEKVKEIPEGLSAQWIIFASSLDTIFFPHLAKITSLVETIDWKTLREPGFYLVDKKTSNPSQWVEEVASWLLAFPRDGVLITGPLAKNTIAAYAPSIMGHTGLLARVSGISKSELNMLFIGDLFNCFLFTDHIPLFSLSQSVQKGFFDSTIQRFISFRRRYSSTFLNELLGEKIILLGIDPHAGDQGVIGFLDSSIKEWLKPYHQELEIIGPVPSDTAFATILSHRSPQVKTTYLCWYHDQGLIPFKLAHGFRGVHWTVGLPFVRLSVDHGPAFDRYGENSSQFDSMFDCMRLALKILVIL